MAGLAEGCSAVKLLHLAAADVLRGMGEEIQVRERCYSIFLLLTCFQNKAYIPSHGFANPSTSSH